MDGLINMAIGFALACFRLLPLLVLPGLSPLAWAPGLVRIAVLMVFAAVLSLVGPITPETLSLQSPLSLAISFLLEFVLGLAFALAMFMPVAALHFAARLADTQAGFSAANILNPGLPQESASVMGAALAMAAGVLFFLLNIHLDLLELLTGMLDLAPLGASMLNLSPNKLLGLMSVQFMAGFLLLAPVILGVFAIDVGAAFATRSMPQANVYFLVLPLKVGAAIVVFAATARHIPLLLERMYATSLRALPSFVH